MFGCNLQQFAHWGGWFTAAMFLLAGSAGMYMVMRFSKKSKKFADRKDSLDILKYRFAKGEITMEEFNTFKSVL